MPSKEENARNGLPETDWRDAQYDMLYLPVQKPSATTTISTATVPLPSCPTADRSTTCTTVAGNLHQISLDDEVITEIERTQGKLASRYELDPQFA